VAQVRNRLPTRESDGRELKKRPGAEAKIREREGENK